MATLAGSPDRHTPMVFDIDEFNIINTTYGTHTGDELLRYFAHLLQGHSNRHNGECHIARLGGNEFALLANNMPVEEALDFTERLRTEFRKKSETLALLKEIQVDYGQGFCIAKPRRLDSLH
nr:diguanylate cyclase [Marinobacter sp. ATCH36]